MEVKVFSTQFTTQQEVDLSVCEWRLVEANFIKKPI